MDHTSGSPAYAREIASPIGSGRGRIVESDYSVPVESGFSWRAWLILGLIALLYIGICGSPVIFDDNEGLYAGSVREMQQRGDWLEPMSNGFIRVQKPPLVYWTMLVSTTVLGDNEFALRLPNALATVAWIVAIFLIMRRLGGEAHGLAAAMILASMLGVWIFTHLVQPEPFLAAFVSLAVWCLLEARASARPWEAEGRGLTLGERFPGDSWYLFFWMFLALGTLSKGLHGMLWPLGTALLAGVFARNWRPWLWPMASWRGVGLYLVMVTPWYAWMSLHWPGFLSAHFINEQIGACLNTRYPADARQLPLVQFYAQHLLFWMPWTLLAPAAVVLSLRWIARARRGVASSELMAQDGVVLVISWVALTLVSVAFSTRQDYYSLSCWGVVAGWLALPWLGAAETPQLRLNRWWLLVPGLLITLAGLAAAALAAWVYPRLSALGAVTAAPIRDRDTFMDAISGISPALWGQSVVLLALFGVALLIGGTLASVWIWQGRLSRALLVLCAMMAVPVLLATAGFALMSPYFSLALPARAINTEMATDAGAADSLVACEALPHTASSLLYYLNVRVHWVNAPFVQQYAQRVLGQGREMYWDETDLMQKWQSSQRVYLIIEQSRWEHWAPLLGGSARVVNRSGTRLTLCNR